MPSISISLVSVYPSFDFGKNIHSFIIVCLKFFKRKTQNIHIDSIVFHPFYLSSRVVFTLCTYFSFVFFLSIISFTSLKFVAYLSKYVMLIAEQLYSAGDKLSNCSIFEFFLM